MKKKHILATLLVLVFALPALAVFNERNLQQTLSVLKYELKSILNRPDFMEDVMGSNHDEQHANMVSMVKKCNELALILYSQNQDFTFDMTYALEEVSDQYAAFNKERMPYDVIVARLEIEIDRYERLVESLRRLPPSLAELSEVPDSISLSNDSLRSFNRLLGTSTAIKHSDISYEHAHIEDLLAEDDDHDHDDHDSEDAHEDHDHSAAHHDDGHGHGHGHEAHDHDEMSIIGALEAFTGVDIHGHNHGEIDDDHDHDKPFMLDQRGQADRDSCLAYALQILDQYRALKDHVDADKEHYDEMAVRLDESFSYAQERYRQLQKRIFIDGQDNYWKVLRSLPEYLNATKNDLKLKYTQVHTDEKSVVRSSWRGPVVSGFIVFVMIYLGISVAFANIVMTFVRRRQHLSETPTFKARKRCITYILGSLIFVLTVMSARLVMHQNFFTLASSLLLVYAWLLLATLLSLMIRSDDDQVNPAMRLYTPILVLGLLVISFRIIFIPNKAVNLVFPPVMVLFSIWQLRRIIIDSRHVQRPDMIYAWITFLLMVAISVLTCLGYVLLGVQVLIWWLFQLTAIGTVTTLYDLLTMYDRKYLKSHLARYREQHVLRIGAGSKGTYIRVTWLYDLLSMMAVPVVAVLSFPFCVWMASDIFDLKEVCMQIFMHPFVNVVDTGGNAILHLSMFKIVLVVALYFVFRYLNYATKAFYRYFKLEQEVKKSGQDYIHANQVNFTLANNLIGIILWGIYIATAVILLKIPMGALSVVAAGLATGIGLALKDVLNNFIYGIQLMSGRLRVGDFIECDGVRGKVESISYQSTIVETLEGALMSFTNSALFNKNFKNLTRNNSYEMVKIPVGVHYGANVENVRKMLSEALKTMNRIDKYGRSVVDQSFGIVVAFSDFGDNSVDLVVKQRVLVEESPAYIAKAKEVIYNTLNANGIEIPYPQRDIYIRQVPSAQDE